MKNLKVSPFDAADYLTTGAHIAAYLDAVLEESPGDVEAIMRALGTAARARNVEGLYKALSGEGNPSFANVMKLSRALGLKVKFEPA